MTVRGATWQSIGRTGLALRRSLMYVIVGISLVLAISVAHAETCAAPNMMRAILNTGTDVHARLVCPLTGLCWYEDANPTIASIVVKCLTKQEESDAEARMP